MASSLNQTTTAISRRHKASLQSVKQSDSLACVVAYYLHYLIFMPSSLSILRSYTTGISQRYRRLSYQFQLSQVVLGCLSLIETILKQQICVMRTGMCSSSHCLRTFLSKSSRRPATSFQIKVWQYSLLQDLIC